jgi:TRAP-type C4-dicarboxylate transport system permease large subunit
MVLFVLSSVSGVEVERISKAIVPYMLTSLMVILLLVVYICAVRAYPNIPLIY